MEAMQIVPMTAEWVPQVAAMEQITFSEPWSEQSLRDAAEDERYCYLLCMEGGKVLGYAGLLLVGDEGQVTNVAVLSEHRGKGIGTKLMQALTAYGRERGVANFFLEVRAGNTNAQGLYAKCGFAAVGRRRGFYRMPPEDAIVMVLSL